MCEGWLWRNEQQLICWDKWRLHSQQSFLQKEKNPLHEMTWIFLGYRWLVYSCCLPKAIVMSKCSEKVEHFTVSVVVGSGNVDFWIYLPRF